MPIQGLPGNPEFQAQIAKLGFRSVFPIRAILTNNARIEFIGVVSKHSKDTSASAQIGLTLKGLGTDSVARYFDSAVDDLIRLGPNDYLTASEAAA